MSEPPATKFCVNCGQRLRVDAKFCVNCGTPIRAVAEPFPAVGSVEPDASDASDAPDAPSGHVAPAAGRTVIAVPTEPEIPQLSVAPPPVAPPPVAAKPTLLNRTQRIVLAVGIGIVILVATAIILLTRNDNHSSVALANNPPATSVAVLPSAAPNTGASVPTPTTIVALSSVVSRLDAELTDSAAQVAQLKSIIAEFNPGDNERCRLFAAAAAAQMGTIINNRTAEVADLQTLATTADATARQLVSLLQTARSLSLQSDSEYQSWIAGNAGTDTTFPCRRAPDTNLQAAQNLEPRVGVAKTTFATAYDPVASRLHLRADWTSNNF
jgi:zinc-ribbon domain